MNGHPWLSALADIYPPDRLLTQPAQVLAYESDALTAFRRRPAGVVLPETSDEVIDTVRLCHRFGVPFVARGSGTSLSGGSLPIDDGLVIALNRLNRILRLDPEERIAVVEPGVVNLDVSRAAAPFGLYYAPDPSSQAVCTIGGNIAFNSGGAHCLKYGMTSNHVMGLKVVLPDGSIVRLGGESLEHVGPDWTGMFVGGEGLFGIALEITLRLLPKPEAFRTVLAAYRSLEAAGDAVGRVVASGLLPGAMEIMDRLAIEAAEAAVHAGYPREAAAAADRRTGRRGPPGAGGVRTPAGGHRRLRRLRRARRPRRGGTPADLEGPQERVLGRRPHQPRLHRPGRGRPRGRLGRALAEIERMSAAHGLRVANVFHAGDGNLHPLILYDGREPGALERAEHLASDIIDLCIRLGGSITGEHGVGVEKRAFMSRLFGPDDLDLMWRVRCAVDPERLANRGKVFGDAGERAEAQSVNP